MAAYFDGNTTENQAPQNQKQREVVAGKRRSHEPRKDRKQCAAKADKPHFMPRPKRADCRNDLPPLLGGPGDDPVEHSSAKIAPVERHIGGEHEADDDIPHRDHTKRSSYRPTTAASCSSSEIVATSS